MPTPARDRAHHRPLRDSLQFLGTFLRDPRRIGAVLPSSRWLAHALSAHLPLRRGDLIVEYGPGTGPMTACLAPLVGEGMQYLGIERDAGFCRTLAARFPGLAFHRGSVEDIEAILAERALPRPRAIISGLPFASLPAAVQTRVIDGVGAVLAPDGEFRTFQYVHAYGLPAARRFRAAIARHLPQFHREGPVLRNVPPAWVLVYRR